MPTLAECDEIIQQQARLSESMSRIKDVIIRQQQVLAEQQKDNERQIERQIYHKASSPNEPEEARRPYPDKSEGNGGFAGADQKKRRGRAAPPGRCHSCNRSETPEWRRGPDGARTLCNACGLRMLAPIVRDIAADKVCRLRKANKKDGQ